MAHTQLQSQMYLVLTSVAGVLAGMNCILFFFCIYVLWGRRSKFRGILLLSSTMQFSLALTQTALYISYLVIAFSLPPFGAESFFRRMSSYSLPCYLIFAINYAVEGLLLIWRIYIVNDSDIKICIPSIILLLLQVGFSGVTAKGFATQPILTGRLHAFYLVTWALIAAVNISATISIGLRLWVAHRRTRMIGLSKYKSATIVVVECGALVTTCTIAMLVLYAVKYPIGLTGLGFTTQVATIAPLLIIARHGILLREDDFRSLPSQIPLRISIARTQDARVDSPVESYSESHLVPYLACELSNGKKVQPFGGI